MRNLKNGALLLIAYVDKPKGANLNLNNVSNL